MRILGTIIIGFIIGALAKLVHPGRDNLGFVMTVLLGIAGSLGATYAGQAVGFYEPGQPAGFIGGILGAILLLVVYAQIKKQGGSGPS